MVMGKDELLFICTLGVTGTQNRGAVSEHAEDVRGSAETQTPDGERP